MSARDRGPVRPTAPPSEAVALWRELAGDEGALAPGAVTVVRGSRGLCPDGWCGVLRLGDAIVVEAGEASDEAVERLLGLSDPTDATQVVSALRPVRTLGPGELAYLPTAAALEPPHAAPAGVAIREARVASIAQWLEALPADDVEESAVAEMDAALVAERDGEPLGTAGHVRWPTDVAHIGLVVAPSARGQGLGVALGAAATRRALRLGLTPQWRAATDNAASRAAARRIGYAEVGRQFSFRLP